MLDSIAINDFNIQAEDYNKIKNYIYLLRSNTPDQKELAEIFFIKNKENVYNNLVKIKDNTSESQDLRLQAMVILKKLYNENLNGNYIHYEKSKNELEIIYDSKYAIMSEPELPDKKKERFNEEIDSLPYVDQIYKEDTYINEEMNRMIQEQMKYLSNIKTNEDYLRNSGFFNLNSTLNIDSELDELVKQKKMFSSENIIKTKFDDPAPNKHHDKDNWNKLLSNLQYSIQQINIKNFNLDLLIKYSPEVWKKYLKNFENNVRQLEIEKSELEMNYEQINKERKFMQIETQEILKEKEEKLQYYMQKNLEIQMECLKSRYKIKKLIKYKKNKLRLRRKQAYKKLK